jgi:uncharacterized membrane protein
MGPLRVPDEAGHMYRAYLVSEGYCTGVPAIGQGADFRYIDRLPWIQLSRHTTGRDLLNLVDDAQGRPIGLISWFYAVNLYSCIPYLPAGAAFRLGRTFEAAPLTLMYFGRFANLLFYLGLVVVAMRLLPEFQLPLAVLALMPMSLHQAASLSADAVTMAVSFIITAYVVRLALAGKPAQLKRSDYLLLLAGVVVAALCKSDAGLVFLLLLIPGTKFPDRRTRWLAIAGYIVLAFGVAALWQYINRPNGEINVTLKSVAGIHPDENAVTILERPVLFLSAVNRTVVGLGHEYLEEFVGKLGWDDIRLPGWIPWVYLVLLVVAAAAYRAGPQLSRWQRILLIGVFVLNVGATFAVVWTTEMSHQAIETDMVAGRGFISGLQGRYLIPFAYSFLIAVSGLIHRRVRGRWIAVSALALIAMVNAVALHIVWNRFQSHTSTAPNRLHMALRLQFRNTPETAALVYDGQLVRGPGPSPEDGRVYFVEDGKKHWVMNGQWIASHGFKTPDDINIIPQTDLVPIPEGDPIR